MAKNLDELRAENPELVRALIAEAQAAVSASAAGGTPAEPQAGADAVSAAVQAEQKRIQEIDAVAGLYDADTVNAAKYGEHACTAQEMTYRAAQQAAQKGKAFLGDLEADTQMSGVNGVGAAPPPKDGGEDPVAQARADAKAFNERKKEVR